MLDRIVKEPINQPFFIRGVLLKLFLENFMGYESRYFIVINYVRSQVMAELNKYIGEILGI